MVEAFVRSLEKEIQDLNRALNNSPKKGTVKQFMNAKRTGLRNKFGKNNKLSKIYDDLLDMYG
jgi:uncharacterized coiled-coil DUF342 family protein